MRFEAPKMFWLLLLIVPPLIGFLWWSWRRRQELITQFISRRLLGHLKVGVSSSRQKARMALLVAAVVLVIFALARPQWGVTREEARLSGLDIIVAIDTSKSMLAEDVPPNRLTRAKLAALDLMLVCPLTLDDAAFSQSVNALDTQTISQGGTAIEQAIEVARKAFKNESDNHKVLVLMTDGEDHEGDAVSAAEAAAKDGMVIFTIGIGTPEGEQLHIRDEQGHLDYIKDEDDKPVISHLNEELLQQIARATKGFYLPLRGTKTMDTVYDMGIAPLPKSQRAVRSFQHFNERFQWFLAVAIVLLIIETFLPDRKAKSSRRATANATAPATTLAETAALLFLLALPFAVRGSPNSALREYNAGDYQGALRDYNQLLESKKDDPRLHFNAGAAAYQSRELDKAAQEFSSALASPDLQLQQHAYYNLGNTLYRAGEQISDTEKKQQAWGNALTNYEDALKLNQQDADAKYNLEYVKKQLEELKKQQQQSQSSDQNQKQDKNNQDQKNQSGKDQKNQQNQQNQQSQDQKNGDKSQSNQDQKSQADNQAKEKSDQEKKQEQQQQAQQSQEKEKEDAAKKESAQNEASGKPQDKTSEEAQQEAAMMAAGQMTPKQAEQLLDSQKDDDKVLQLAPPNKNTLQSRSFKDW
jgi:Ca-activated chloride channel family protein